LRDQNQLSQVIALYKDTVFQQQVIKQVVLYESRLTPAGPEYTPLKKFTLK
jgi:2'-5' RNA ligase